MAKTMQRFWIGTGGLALTIGICAGCGCPPDTPLARAAERGDAGEVRELLRKGSDPDEVGASGLSPLIRAARAGNEEVVKALLAGGAKPDLRDRRSNRWTPLVHAIHKGRNEAALAILEAGADPDARMDGDATPLMFAAAYGNTEMVRALLDHGADPRAEARGGVSALWGALGGGALFDITDGPPLGTCFPDTAHALLERAPDLTLKKGLASTVVETIGRSKECSDLIARVGS